MNQMPAPASPQPKSSLRVLTAVRSATSLAARRLPPASPARLAPHAALGVYEPLLDALTEPVALYDANGREVYVNPALRRRLAADPEGAQLRAALRRAAFACLHGSNGYSSNGYGSSGHASNGVPQTGPQPDARLRATRLPLPLSAWGAAVLVSVAPEVAPRLPDAGTLRLRYGLTQREAEVALLLAEGLSNAELAGRLYISPHTARRHTEQVLAKLGLGSRKALALRLLQMD